ncbi:MAG: hypothetical protein HY321_22080 [Armatimonadetes bacterium]|nr:hypothetical protein [Armatimonadota bacterium]
MLVDGVMGMATKEQVIDLVHRLSPEDLDVVKALLERLVPPVPTLDELQARWDATPPDDEPVSEDTAREIAEAFARWNRDRTGVAHGDVE